MPQSLDNGAAGGADLQQLQRRRKHALRVGALLGVALLLVSGSAWGDTAPGVQVLLQRGGFLLILLCIVGRTWCTLYIGGRKKRALTTKGPYSIVRNPLYVFSIIGVAGTGLLAGSVVMALLFGALALAMFAYVTAHEEAFLADAFGKDFAAYAATVPRFWPRFSIWQDADELLIRPRLVLRTFLEASLFLLAVPLIDLKDMAQQSGLLPVLLQLP
jgi:protein-S-isoprenylcysteine O-methyltransferase Ste14